MKVFKIKNKIGPNKFIENDKSVNLLLKYSIGTSIIIADLFGINNYELTIKNDMITAEMLGDNNKFIIVNSIKPWNYKDCYIKLNICKLHFNIYWFFMAYDGFMFNTILQTQI